MTRVSGTLDERSGLSDERATGRFSDHSVGVTSLATGGVVADVTHEFVDSQRFTSNGRLISGDDGDTSVVILILIGIGMVLGVVLFRVADKLLVLFPTFLGVVVTD